MEQSGNNAECPAVGRGQYRRNFVVSPAFSSSFPEKKKQEMWNKPFDVDLLITREAGEIDQKIEMERQQQ